MLPSRDNVRNVCALHLQGDTYRIVVAQIGGVSGSGPAQVDIKLAESVRVTAGPAAITSILERVGGVDLVIRLLTGAASIVRTCTVPAGAEGDSGDAASVQDALSLIAESELPTSLPSYRRCAGVVHPGRGHGRKPVGLLVGWPPFSAADETENQRPPRLAPEIWVSETAALAHLAQAVGGVDRAWLADSHRGAVSIVAVGPEKTLIRVARVESDESFGASARQAITETCKLAATPGGDAIPGDGVLVLEPNPASPRLAGSLRDGTWISQYGIAAAAILMYADGHPAVNALVNLHEVEPKTKPPLLARVTQWLGAPRRAAAIIALCVIAGIGVPIGVSYARMHILKGQVGDWNGVFTSNTRSEQELAFYRLLGEKRWPMTKLLADISGACPVGITLDAVELGVGEQVVIRGVAEDSGKITTFRANLGATRIFTDVASPSSSPVSGGMQFQITARIPSGAGRLEVKPVEDFASKTLMERMYGESARGVRASTTTRSDRASGRDRRASSTDTRASDTGRSSSGSTRTSSTTAAKEPPVIPPPLTDAEIAAMKFEQAMPQFGQRRKAASQSGLDEATKRRLTEEAQKLRDRLDQLKSGGGK